jgi:hypothetical protein
VSSQRGHPKYPLTGQGWGDLAAAQRAVLPGVDARAVRTLSADRVAYSAFIDVNRIDD